MGFPKQILCLLLVLFFSTQIDCNRPKRMFALCPPHFIRIGNECYFISQNRVNWLDAHFECLDRNSRLAEPYKQEDRFLRKYLNHLRHTTQSEVWIGARFNWERNRWQWGHNGQDLTYQSFSQMSADNKDLKFHCAIMKPNLKYRWSASSCEQQHQYICQHRMPYVNEKNRQKIYTKWNETYPNEMANEIEVVLSENDLSRNRRRKMHRSHMKANNRQIKIEPNYRQRNDIHFSHLPQPDQIQNRKTRMGGNRPRNQAYHRRFEINRNRANGIRQGIQFNSTNSASNRQFNRNRILHQHHQRPNNAMNSSHTINPNTWSHTNVPGVSKTTLPMLTPKRTTTSTTTMRTTLTPATTTTTTSPAPPMVISNDVTQIEDHQYQRRMEEAEQRRYEEKLRREQEIMEQEQRTERERLQNEERMRAIHQMELDRRRQEIINEQQRALENQRIQDEKRRQDLERRKQDELNRQRYEEEKNRQAELQRQRENQSSQQRAIQTNEILENTVVTTLTPIEKKKLKLKRLHDRLSKLSPEEQEIFYKKRAERNKKRGVENQMD